MVCRAGVAVGCMYVGFNVRYDWDEMNWICQPLCAPLRLAGQVNMPKTRAGGPDLSNRQTCPRHRDGAWSSPVWSDLTGNYLRVGVSRAGSIVNAGLARARASVTVAA